MFRFIKIESYNENIGKVLSLCIYKPTVIKTKNIIDNYLLNENMVLYMLEDDSIVIGIVGLEINTNEVEILHIAVEYGNRSKGIGSILINEVQNRYKAMSIIAETDDDAVVFYRKTGFNIQSLGEKYKGIIRYKCIKYAVV